MATDGMLGGTFTFVGGDVSVGRVGYGAMRLSGPHIMGAPKDRDEALAVLRGAVEAGVNHIDTSDFYGPHITNELIREALHPYRDNLVIVTKVGFRRNDKGAWLPAQSVDQLVSAVDDNLRNLQLDVLPVVNFRAWTGGGPPREGSIAEQFEALARLVELGKIEHLGVSTVTPAQVAEAQAIAPVVCVQNEYNVVKRDDDALIDSLVAQGVAYVPYFPLGGFTPLQGGVLQQVAAEEGRTVMQVALAWLLQRAPNVLLIPGTSSVSHLKENLAVAEIELSAKSIDTLNGLAGQAAT